jgi:hypothetical protein
MKTENYVLEFHSFYCCPYIVNINNHRGLDGLGT